MSLVIAQDHTEHVRCDYTGLELPDLNLPKGWVVERIYVGDGYVVRHRAPAT